MKNLKKVLALALAVIMVMSLFTVAFAAETKSAADLTDYADIEKKDAVNLAVDLGIIAGKPDGSFDPKGNIDRASWAKMVYYVATGDDNADVFKGGTTTLKDISTSWAEGYIAYLAANEYVSGDQFGNFNPTANVTTAEAAKMLLTVMGYDAEDRGYQNNAAWSGNIMTDAKRNGLMDNVDNKVLEALTRENAAQMIYNALEANMVEEEAQYDMGNKYVTKYNKVETLGYYTFNLVKLTATVNGVTNGKVAAFTGLTDGDNCPEGTLAALGGKIKAAANLDNCKVSFFVKATGVRFATDGTISTYGDFDKIVSSTVAAAKNTAFKVVTSGFTSDAGIGGALTSGHDDYVGSGATSVNMYTFTNTGRTSATITKATTTAIGAGQVVEFYKDSNGDIDTVKVYDYMTGALTGDVETKTKSDELYVKLPGVSDFNTWTVKAAGVTGWEGLKEGDRVLYYKDNDGNWIIEKAEKITGTVTGANSKGELTINGEKHALSGLTALKGTSIFNSWTSSSNSSFSNWNENDAEFDFYLDKNGNIIDAEQITETTDKSKVVLVLNAQWDSTDIDDDATAAGSLKVKVLFTDGSTEVVKVTELADVDAGAYEVKPDGSTADATVSKWTAANGAAVVAALKKNSCSDFFLYKTDDDGNYELTHMDSSAWKSISITDQSPKNTIEQKSGFYTAGGVTANNKTLFIVAKTVDSKTTYTTYTGFKNVPEILSATGTAICDGKSSTVAKYVYIATTAFNDDAPEGYFFVKSSDWEQSGKNYLVNIVTSDGVEDTLLVNSTVKSTLTTSTNLFNMYAITSVNDDGVVTGISASANYNYESAKSVTSLGDGVIAIDGVGSYDYDDETVIVAIELEETSDEDGNAKRTKVKFVGASNVTDVDKYFGFDSADVDPTDANGKPWESITAVAVGTVGKTADYIYVIRVANA